jgi:ribosomal RNA assembly protein
VRIPLDRIGVVVGKQGRAKRDIEEKCKVKLNVNSSTGDVALSMTGPVEDSLPLIASNIVDAIAKGFSPPRAMKLLDEETELNVIDLREYAGKSKKSLDRVKGRIIGMEGKSRRLIEQLTGSYVSVSGHTAALIGDPAGVRRAAEAVRGLAAGRTHKAVYTELQRAKTREKLDRITLWEGKHLAF